MNEKKKVTKCAFDKNYFCQLILLFSLFLLLFMHLHPVSQKTKETTSQKNTKTKASCTVYKHNTLEEACDLGVFLSKYFCPHLLSSFFPNFK